MLRARRPHLLPVDDEAVAVAHRTRAERREVRSGVRLAHAEAPRDLRRSVGSAKRSTCSGVPWSTIDGVMIDRPCGFGGAVDAPLRELLEVHELLRRRRVAAAQLGRPTGDEPAGVEQRPLPAARPRTDVSRGALRIRRRLLGGVRVRAQPLVELGAERLVMLGVHQSHGAAPY